jgi:tetratricopeptide (TPR) repeat protein
MAPWAKSAGEKGLPLDRANSEAHSVLVILAVICHYDWKVAETQHRKAVATEPVPHMVRMGHAQFYLLPWGRFADAEEQYLLSLETGPLSVILHFGMALSMSAAEQYRETIEYASRALEIDANFHYVWLTMGLA